MLNPLKHTFQCQLHTSKQTIIPTRFATATTQRKPYKQPKYTITDTTSHNNDNRTNKYNKHNDTVQLVHHNIVGKLWTYGSGFFGGLCNNDNTYNNKLHPSAVQSVSNIEFTQISAGWCKTLAIDTQHNVYEWGWYHRMSSLIFVAKLRNKLQWLLLLLQRIPINSRFLLRHATLQPRLIDKFEQINSQGETIYFSNLQARYIEVGSDYYGIIDTLGHVYTAGNGFYGQLGHDGSIRNTNLKHAKRIETLAHVNIVQLACGFNHMLLLTDTGIVLACGRCKDGQLGIHDPIHDGYRVFYPTVVPATHPQEHAKRYIGKVIQIGAGIKHSIFLTETGHVYTCGSNLYGELGVPELNFKNSDIPVHVNAIREKVVKIACSSHHNVALCENGTVYTWGFGQHGQCAQLQSNAVSNNTTKNQALNKQRFIYLPNKIQLSSHLLPGGDTIINISCGFYDTILHTKRGNTIVCGGCTDQHEYNAAPRLLCPSVKLKQVAFGLAHMTMIVDSYTTVDTAMLQV